MVRIYFRLIQKEDNPYFEEFGKVNKIEYGHGVTDKEFKDKNLGNIDILLAEVEVFKKKDLGKFFLVEYDFSEVLEQNKVKKK